MAEQDYKLCDLLEFIKLLTIQGEVGHDEAVQFVCGEIRYSSIAEGSENAGVCCSRVGAESLDKLSFADCSL